MVLNEWLPNPAGRDADNEWIELWNDEGETVALKGWSIVVPDKKSFLPAEHVPAGGYALFRSSDLGLTLRNVKGSVGLLDASGKTVSEAAFLGSAPEGQSFGRNGQEFSWLAPTPGEANAVRALAVHEEAGLVTQKYLNGPELLYFLFAAAALLTCAVWLAIKSNEDLAKLFFEAN